MELQRVVFQQVAFLFETIRNFNPLYFFILVLSIFALYVKLIRRKNKTKLNLPPSPPKLPIIGNLHQISALLHHPLAALAKKYGPDLMLMQLGQTPFLIVSSAEMAREMMKTHDAAFSDRPQVTAPRIHFYGCNDVAFAPYGEYWRQTRKVSVLELLSVKRVQSFQFVREEEVQVLVQRLHKAALDGLTVNLTDLLLLTSNNVVSRCIVGKKFDEGIGRSKYAELSRDMLEQFSTFCIGDFFPSLSWIDELRGVVRQIKKTHKEFDEFLRQVIIEHKVKHASPEYDPNSDKVDFVDILLKVQRDGTTDFKLTDDSIKAIIVDMLVGGSDTSSTTIEWTMAELIRNPNVMKKAQEEVRRVLGIKKTKIEQSDLSEMRYLDCAIKEALRLHPPGPLLAPRQTSAAIKDMGGYDIPVKTRVLVNVYSIQRDPKLWKNPTEFIPERFMEGKIEIKGDQENFRFLPFGGGRRGCPGSTFAVASAKYFLANFLYRFDWILPEDISKPEDMDMGESPGISVSKKVPIRLRPIPYCP